MDSRCGHRWRNRLCGKVLHRIGNVTQHFGKIVCRRVGMERRAGEMKADALRSEAIEFCLVDGVARRDDHAILIATRSVWCVLKATMIFLTFRSAHCANPVTRAQHCLTARKRGYLGVY